MKYLALLLLLLLPLAACSPPSGIVRTQEIPPASAADQATASKVAAVMQANDITLPQVAAYLYAYGWTVVPAPLPRAHWRAAAPGTYPISYYVVEIRAAVADTAFAHYITQAAGPYRIKVKAVDTHQTSGPWSLVGWSDGGDGSTSLPGVGE